jgi:hypothetical protein
MLLFNLIFTSGHEFCRPYSLNVSVLPEDGPLRAATCSCAWWEYSGVNIYGASVGFLCKIGISMQGYGQDKKNNIKITGNTIISFNKSSC